ncbi:MAG: divergent polysaccharide deacetylase family protein [Candidatus Omnitrophota bacterium]|jgi:polysaccharide deacetylase 2 family uncharacterized protein YibQ|nr:MAG: divergent polysaccharide deacetylase family protein [Candidatus Omnitrophota bacterium]
MRRSSSRADSRYRVIIIILVLIILGQFFAFWILPKAKKEKPKVKLAKKGEIAIVLDDWGYNTSNLELLRSIDMPITLAVLPNLPYSKQVASFANEHGLEVILHLPLEPKEKFRLEDNTLMVSMSQKQAIDILDSGLKDLVYAKGVSNHMGSRATEDRRLVKIIFSHLKENNLYFFDSFVSSESVCAELAGQLNLRFAKRDIFLDNSSNPAYIRGQINKLKAIANKRGYAIGIGHDRKNTLMVLKEIMPVIEKEGFKFVLLSQLIRNERSRY